MASALCKGGHKLTKYKAKVAGVSCDNCGKRCGHGVFLHGCRKCDYDLCSNCTNDGKGQAKVCRSKQMPSDSQPQAVPPSAAKIAVAISTPSAAKIAVAIPTPLRARILFLQDVPVSVQRGLFDLAGPDTVRQILFCSRQFEISLRSQMAQEKMRWRSLKPHRIWEQRLKEEFAHYLHEKVRVLFLDMAQQACAGRLCLRSTMQYSLAPHYPDGCVAVLLAHIRKMLKKSWGCLFTCWIPGSLAAPPWSFKEGDVKGFEEAATVVTHGGQDKFEIVVHLPAIDIEHAIQTVKGMRAVQNFEKRVTQLTQFHKHLLPPASQNRGSYPAVATQVLAAASDIVSTPQYADLSSCGRRLCEYIGSDDMYRSLFNTSTYGVDGRLTALVAKRTWFWLEYQLNEVHAMARSIVSRLQGQCENTVNLLTASQALRGVLSPGEDASAPAFVDFGIADVALSGLMRNSLIDLGLAGAQVQTTPNAELDEITFTVSCSLW